MEKLQAAAMAIFVLASVLSLFIIIPIMIVTVATGMLLLIFYTIIRAGQQYLTSLKKAKEN